MTSPFRTAVVGVATPQHSVGKLGKTEDYSGRPRTLGSGAICCCFRRFQSSSVTICIAGLLSSSHQSSSKQRKKLGSRTSKLNDVREWRRKVINRYLLFGSGVSDTACTRCWQMDSGVSMKCNKVKSLSHSRLTFRITFAIIRFWFTTITSNSESFRLLLNNLYVGVSGWNTRIQCGQSSRRK